MAKQDPMLSVDAVSLRYANGLQALQGIDLRAEKGELVCVLGSNGSGKSTLIKCIARLLKPTEGRIQVAGLDMHLLSGRELRHTRSGLGVVGQSANLVRRRSVMANVAIGSLAGHNDVRTALGFWPRAEAGFAWECLVEVDLQAHAHKRAGELSGGQAQRLSIARALAQRPRVLLADEPIASLDPEAAEEIMRLLRRLADGGLAVVVVLHQPDMALRYADRLAGLVGGRLVFDLPSGSVERDRIDALYRRDAA